MPRLIDAAELGIGPLRANSFRTRYSGLFRFRKDPTTKILREGGELELSELGIRLRVEPGAEVEVD